MNTDRLLSIVFATAFATSVFAQVAPVPAPARVSAGSAQITMSANPGMRVGAPVLGMPYSAEQVTESVQTLADGTHIRQNRQSEMLYRDSQGRTRTERSMFLPPGANSGAAPPKIVEIVDVVGGYRYTLDDVNKIAHRVPIEVMQPPKGTGTGAAAAWVERSGTMVGMIGPGGPAGPVVSRAVVANGNGSVSPTRPEMQNEDLGTQSIEGVMAKGHKMTQTWPVDSIGNDRPIVVVNESWFSDQLRVMVLSKNSDPRSGDRTTSLKNISLAEPDPSLFQPPPGYQIVEDTGNFKIPLAK